MVKEKENECRKKQLAFRKEITNKKLLSYELQIEINLD
jgi:hypothetical protein